MKFFVRLAVLFYVALIFILSVFALLFVFHRIPLSEITNGLSTVYSDDQVRLIVGVSSVLVILVNHMFLKLLLARNGKGKTIAFDNPSGRVSVSLSAMEDLVKRVILSDPEIKEVRSEITAGKKGLKVEARIVLNSDVNIPEMTSRLQNMVKRKVQDTVGIEEEVVVRVHVHKIIPGNKPKQEKQKKVEDEKKDTVVPFQGYRA